MSGASPRTPWCLLLGSTAGYYGSRVSVILFNKWVMSCALPLSLPYKSPAPSHRHTTLAGKPISLCIDAARGRSARASGGALAALVPTLAHSHIYEFSGTLTHSRGDGEAQQVALGADTTGSSTLLQEPRIQLPILRHVDVPDRERS